MSGTSVLVLAGGPDAEREVSLASAGAITSALQAAGYAARMQTIGTPTLDELRAMEGEVVFPALHGRYGEGGPLQDLLVELGRPFVGSGPRSARLAMDKIATKAIALSMGIPTAPACVLEPKDNVCPLELPVVVKPIHEGSTIGLHVCRTVDQWRAAHNFAAGLGRPCMIEPFIAGREITVGLLGGIALPLIEIVPAEGLYDYEAKYTRNDTRYIANPNLAPGLAERIASDAARLWAALGCRHVARADFLLDASGRHWLLEINTMPGFTDHSLVPMAAAAIPGAPMDMPALCAALVEMARQDAQHNDTSQGATRWPETASARA
ncbi:MAG: D-alanine--D-alanine ligase [Phycisphaeraceae bacterium]|nr:MAG: D-alanine--D-alanine ligase [Phycisphaeraceae bacterium]